MSPFVTRIGLLLAAAPVCFAASEPLDQWAWRNPLPNGAVSDLMGVTYANGTFAAVGDGAALVTSTDGTNWVSRTAGPLCGLGTNYYLAGLSWGNGKWVAVGLGNYPDVGGDFPVILTSPDLVAWARQVTPSSVDNLFGIAYASGLFVAVGSANDPASYQEFGAILTSPDGVEWTLQNSGTTDYFLKKVIYGNGLFVVGSTRGNVLTSPDGVNWTFGTRPARQAHWPLGLGVRRRPLPGGRHLRDLDFHGRGELD